MGLRRVCTCLGVVALLGCTPATSPSVPASGVPTATLSASASAPEDGSPAPSVTPFSLQLDSCVDVGGCVTVLTIAEDGTITQDEQVRQLSTMGMLLVAAMLDQTGLFSESRVIVPTEGQPIGAIGFVFSLDRSGAVVEVEVTTQGAQWDTPEATTLLDLADQLQRLPEILPSEAWVSP